MGNDPTSSWGMGYRHVFWALIHPEGPNPRTGDKTGIEVLGDDTAVKTLSTLIRSHGFKPVIRPGGCDVAPGYEVGFSGRIVGNAKAPHPGPGKDSDGLVGPFTASPMLAFDVLGHKWFGTALR